MAETCGWSDCRSSEMQAHMVTHQCLTCGRHSQLGRPVVWVRDPEMESGKWIPGEQGHPEGSGGPLVWPV